MLALGTSLSSCQDYLDKEPDSTVSADDAFANFRNFQGFVEEIYNCIPDKEKCNYCPSWNWGDDEIFNPEADNGAKCPECGSELIQEGGCVICKSCGWSRCG